MLLISSCMSLAIPGCTSSIVPELSQCLKAINIWVGKSWIWLRHSMTEWLWVFGSRFMFRNHLSEMITYGCTPTGTAGAQFGVVAGFAALGGGAAGSYVPLSFTLPHSWSRTPCSSPSHFLLTYCNALYMGLLLKTHPEITTDSECSTIWSSG